MSADPSAAIRADPGRPKWLTDDMLPLPVGTERVYGESDTHVRIAMPSGHLWADYDPHWNCAQANREIDADHWEVYHVPPPQPEKAKPAAASAWEEWMGVYKALPFTTDPPAKEFNRWVAAREKDAVEAYVKGWAAKYPTAGFDKPDAGRAEGVDKDDLLYEAWGVIANACNGNWDLERPEWKEAAVRWRDKWHKTLNAPAPKPRRALEVEASKPVGPSTNPPQKG